MFIARRYMDTNGIQQTGFFLTQGDTAALSVKPTKDGRAFQISKISKCTFKLSNKDFVQTFTKELVVDTETSDKFNLTLSPTETAAMEVGDYIYEIEYTLTDTSVYTSNQGVFKVLQQIVQGS